MTAPFAGKPVAANGADGECTALTTRVVFPVLVNLTSPLSLPPSGVEPSSSDSVESVSAERGSSAEPDRAILVSSASVVRPSDPLKGSGVDDLKVTFTVITSPGSITLPTLGRPVASNGADGVCTALTVSLVPVLVNVTLPAS